MRVARYDEVAPTKAQRRAFSCGQPSLDHWLVTQARQSLDSRDAVTYLLLDDLVATTRIAGYYCLSAGQVRRSDATDDVGRRAPEPVPVLRMGRFAIDSAFQGQGWASELLRDALLRAVSAATVVGARALLVDAIDDRAAEFYKRHWFVASPVHPRLLMCDLRTIAAALEGG